MNAVLKGEKILRERILKTIFICEIHYSEYQLVYSDNVSVSAKVI